jgi:hypothetical protein
MVESIRAAVGSATMIDEEFDAGSVDGCVVVGLFSFVVSAAGISGWLGFVDRGRAFVVFDGLLLFLESLSLLLVLFFFFAGSTGATTTSSSLLSHSFFGGFL